MNVEELRSLVRACIFQDEPTFLEGFHDAVETAVFCAGWCCEYCHAPEQVFNFAFEVDHILPRSRDGDKSPNNLALACESCNLHKSNSVASVDLPLGQLARLFNPRRDSWNQHFELDGESGELHGLTPIGRSTIYRLKMNSAFQLRARRHWVALGLYP